MWFKNLTVYRFNKPFSVDTESMEKSLEDFTFSPCSSQDVSKFGFSNALGKHGDSLVHTAADRHLICATKEEKLLPAQVIKEALEDKVALLESEDGRKLAKKEKDALKDEIIMTLLPRAFSRRSQIRALILPEIQMVLVDSSSAAKSEELMALLRKAIGTLPIIPISFKTPIETQLTEWLKEGKTPAAFEMQDEAELKSDSDEGGIVRFKQQDLTENEVLAHIEVGKQVHKLALHFGQSIAFLLQSDAAIKRLKFSEEFRAGNDDVGDEDPMARLDADFALMSSELIALVNSVVDSLGGLEDSI
ncbi:recombination-associated protein RdgC [Shewanella sp. Choline-02u-19]|jgi:recombination associated protein RdgC|uniref:recombination-associated protein RdgC n=1 Tax=unclassified Shewanella TaxID=196818 RepID=UPI000C33BCC4|nr:MULTISPECIES: recombination-associated protein RdgC [unclassified Shewanella]PKG57077.1 recombination-associated protein RdgC [Shewanella sp. GutDb-MelDb]PKG76373.1 recombination-associated protein RdgC [Shewanella sp. GutCb]PKH57494.1 recombination-associated protein RdgC [Shewanella sp. Bg11-22]PKI28356.1 recombination-associated protein RdgC [Shewanella sp. Choline-02u-19]